LRGPTKRFLQAGAGFHVGRQLRVIEQPTIELQPASQDLRMGQEEVMLPQLRRSLNE
jgi:hypothetical protein